MVDAVNNTANTSYWAEDAKDTFAVEIPAAIGITTAMGTSPLWGKYLTKPYETYKEMNKTPGKTYTSAWQAVGARREAEKKSLSYLQDKNSWWNTKKNRYNYRKMNGWAKELPTYDKRTNVSKLNAKELAKFNNQKQAHACYSKARQLIQEAKSKKLKGQALKEQLKKIVQAMSEGDAKLNKLRASGAIKQTSKFGKIKHWTKSKTGYYKAKGALLKTSRGASGLKMAGRCAKGTAIMAILGGIMEIPDLIMANDIDKYEKQNGRASNALSRQVGKSTVKVGAGILGYAAGSAAAGAAVGSIVPVAGTAAGFVVGAIGGCIGGLLAQWGAEAIVGKKSEAELYAEKHADEEELDEEEIFNAIEDELTERENEVSQSDDEDYDEYDDEYYDDDYDDYGETSQTTVSCAEEIRQLEYLRNSLNYFS